MHHVRLVWSIAITVFFKNSNCRPGVTEIPDPEHYVDDWLRYKTGYRGTANMLYGTIKPLAGHIFQKQLLGLEHLRPGRVVFRKLYDRCHAISVAPRRASAEPICYEEILQSSSGSAFRESF